MKRDEKYFKGCILGGAIGDALGRPIELKKLKEIKATYGSKGIIYVKLCLLSKYIACLVKSSS